MADETVSGSVGALSSAGDYVVGRRVLARDGHSMDGAFTLSVCGARPRTDDSSEGGAPDPGIIHRGHAWQLSAGAAGVAFGLMLAWRERQAGAWAVVVVERIRCGRKLAPLAEARQLIDVGSVQNRYSVLDREHEAVLDACTKPGSPSCRGDQCTPRRHG